MTRESDALEHARGELGAIIGELAGIKARIRAVADGLTAAESVAAVVDVDPDGRRLTVEAWIAERLVLDMTEALDNFMSDVAYQSDFDSLRGDIRASAEQARKVVARRA